MRETVRTMTDDPVVLRIMDQLKIEGKTEKDLVKHLKMANGTFSSWKFANVKSYRKRIGEIASFLGVSSEYLLEGKDDYINKDTLTATEIKLLKAFRMMGNEQQITFMKVGDFFATSTKFDRMKSVVIND